MEGCCINKLETSLFHILNQEHYTSIEREKLKFGIQTVLSEISKLLVIYLFVIIFDCFIPTVITHMAFLFLRQVGLGYHFKKLSVCLVWSIIAFPIAVKIIMHIYIHIPPIVLYTLFLFTVVWIFLLAPKGTENQPIVNEKHRKHLRKKMAIRLCILIGVFIISTIKVQMFIAYGVLLEFMLLIIQSRKERLINETQKAK